LTRFFHHFRHESDEEENPSNPENPIDPGFYEPLKGDGRPKLSLSSLSSLIGLPESSIHDTLHLKKVMKWRIKDGEENYHH